MQYADGSDAELLERARAGSAPAFAVLVPHAVFTLGSSGDEVPDEPTNLVARPFEEELDEAPPDPPPFEFPDEAP